MSPFSIKRPLLAGLLALSLSTGAALAAEPAGFGTPATVAPQGFGDAAVMSIAQLKADAKDKEIVALEGRFVERLEKDKYLFKDRTGDTITAELDDDKDWTHVVKDQPMKITVEVDRDWNSVEVEVIDAK